MGSFIFTIKIISINAHMVKWGGGVGALIFAERH